MELEIVSLNDSQISDIESRLEDYDKKHMTYKISGDINIGIIIDGNLVGGASACMTAYKILYLSTLYVDENYRGLGLGRSLMKSLEEKALELGANIIRLDTFDWQGAEFYKKIGYEQVGFYSNDIDGFSEYFFLKRLA